jgi:hypothetical protein
MIQVAAFLGTLWGRVALGAGVVVALVGLRAWDVSNQRAIGASKQVAKQERAADANAKKAEAARRSVERSPGRVLNDRYGRD